MNVGDTFFAADHLWVVAAKSAADEVVVFNFTTFHPHCDASCVVEAGEHSFIKHKTVVSYARGLLLNSHAQDHMAAHPALFPPDTSVSAVLLAKIQRGARTSRNTPQKLQTLIPPDPE